MLLDTHVWVWTVQGDARKVGRQTQRAIERSAVRGELYVCAASAFEIAALHTAGRLELAFPPGRWIRESIEVSRFGVLDVSSAIAIDAGLIPAKTLPDPFDRLIVATAADAGLSLVTRDERILEFARTTRRVRVVDAAR